MREESSWGLGIQSKAKDLAIRDELDHRTGERRGS